MGASSFERKSGVESARGSVGVGSSTSSIQEVGAAGIKRYRGGGGYLFGMSSISSSRSAIPFIVGFIAGGNHKSGSSNHGSSSNQKSDELSSSTGKGSSSSNTGGSTKTGSGVTPNYGGGRYYGGGATTPYTAGARSPLGILAVPLAFSALAFYPGIWLYGAYAYPYSHPYTFYNRTATNHTNTTTTTRDLHFDIEIRQDTGVTETKNVTCLCAMYAECGCDDNGNTTFLNSLIGDGTYANLNLSLVNVADINGTSTIVLNGTLPNGTTASGGTENASGAVRAVIDMSGYWVMIALVGATVYLV